MEIGNMFHLLYTENYKIETNITRRKQELYKKNNKVLL